MTRQSRQLALVHVVNPIRGEHRVVEAGNADGARAVIERMAARYGRRVRTRRLASNHGAPVIVATDVVLPAAHGTYEYASHWEKV